VENAWRLYGEIADSGVGAERIVDMVESFRNRQLCFAHAVYLESILFALDSGVGSRGSALALTANGVEAHPLLGPEWRFATEDSAFREKLLVSEAMGPNKLTCRWIERRPIPVSDAWFETTWREFRENGIFRNNPIK
jgi:hypothetical protein